MMIMFMLMMMITRRMTMMMMRYWLSTWDGWKYGLAVELWVKLWRMKRRHKLATLFLFLIMITTMMIRGVFKKKNGKSWSFGPTGGPPPPLPGSWSTLKWKKFRCLFCILDYSEHFNFSWIFHENVLFLGGFQVGTGEPPPSLEIVPTLAQLFPFPFWGAPRGVQ